jgi:hypothetical protein
VVFVNPFDVVIYYYYTKRDDEDATLEMVIPLTGRPVAINRKKFRLNAYLNGLNDDSKDCFFAALVFRLTYDD